MKMYYIVKSSKDTEIMADGWYELVLKMAELDHNDYKDEFEYMEEVGRRIEMYNGCVVDTDDVFKFVEQLIELGFIATEGIH